MTISIWRYSHLVLALASSLFLIIASVTGVILAVEPISHQAKGHAVRDLDDVSLATTIDALQSRYDEVLSLEVETSTFVKASVLTAEMESLDIYIDAQTGEQLSVVQERPWIYSFSTNLHRSLFLKSLGRFFVALFSLLLLLIMVTGVLLLAKRQGGFKRLFSKVQKDYFELRYHVILSRWCFIPIVILAFTGVYLSAEKFDLLPATTVEHMLIANPEDAESARVLKGISVFKEISLNEVRQVEFPFSEDPEEYFLIALKDREIQVHQHSGQIMSSAEYPFVAIASHWSRVLHTGEGSIVWSIILLLASGSILFFIYSGLMMTVKRKKSVATIIEMPDKDVCEFVILVGSETGMTLDFGRRLYNALTAIGKKVYLTELNKYSVFAKAEQVIVLTSTYGEGESPTNARKFKSILTKVEQPNKINFSVVGFGSLEYPDYCKFAIKVDALLQRHSSFKPLLPLYKINNADFNDFSSWVAKLSERLEISLAVQQPTIKPQKYRKVTFDVLERSVMNVDDTFLIRLRPRKKVRFTSGDLLSVFPDGADIVRQYSIARIKGHVLLSVKKHAHGIGSAYLYGLKQGDSIEAAIEANTHFHFPKKTASAILIANGTGIAPFLGMIDQHSGASIHLFWGGKNAASSAIYDEVLNGKISGRPQLTIHKSYSREGRMLYVQQQITQQPEVFLKTIRENGVIMICGSLAMQHAVLDLLEQLLEEHTAFSLDELQHNGQLKMDCY